MATRCLRARSNVDYSSALTQLLGSGGLDYAQLAENYVRTRTTRFMKHANPWALRGIIEKLSGPSTRVWQEPDPS